MSINSHISKKIGLLLLTIFLIASVHVLIIFKYQNYQKHGSCLMDIAGRQGMLSQKITKLVILMVTGSDVDREELLTAIAMYDTSLSLLHFGGIYKGNRIPPVPRETRNMLVINDSLWSNFKTQAELITFSKQDFNSYDKAIRYITEKNDELLIVSDRIVENFRRFFGEKAVLVQKIMLLVLVMDVVVFLVAFIIVKRLVNPVVYLSEVAKKLGKRDFPQVINIRESQDETGQLVKSFKQMVSDLRQSEYEVKKKTIQLGESEERFSSVVETTRDAITSLDGHGNIVFWNTAAETMFGYSPAEITGQPLTTIISEQSGKIPGLKYKNADEAGVLKLAGKNLEFTGLRKDGIAIPVELSLSSWDTDNETYFTGVIRDISERKKAEEEKEALRRLSYRLTEPLSAKAVGRIVAEESRSLFQHDAFTIDLINESKNKLVGLYNEDTLPTHQAPEEMPTREIPIEAIKDRDILDGKPKLINRWKKPDDTDFIRFGDKTRLSRSLMFVPILQEKEVMGVLSVQSYAPGCYREKDLELLQTFANQCSGALARIRAEYALRKSENKYRTLFEQSKDALFISAENGRLLEVNRSMIELFGYSRDEMMSFILVELFAHSDDRKKMVDVVLKQSSISDHEIKLRKKDGSVIDCLITSGVRRDEEGNILGYEGSIRDISKIKQAEKNLALLATFPRLQPNPIIEVNYSGKVTYFNPVAAINFSGLKLYSRQHPALKGIKKIIKRFGKGKSASFFREIEVEGAYFEQHINYVPEIERIRIYHTDITERKRVESALRERYKLESLINSISSKFINLTADKTEEGINDSLATVGEFLKVDRGYIFQLMPDKKTLVNTFEWSANINEYHFNNLQIVPVDTIPKWMNKMFNFEEIAIPNLTDSSPEEKNEISIFQSKHVKSLIALPLVYAGSLVGFIGFVSVYVERTWSGEVVDLLKRVSEIITSALQYKWAQDALQDSESKYRSIVETSHDLIWMTDRRGNFTYVNRRGTEITGHKPEKVIGRNSGSFIHPDDLDQARINFLKVIHKGKVQTSELRIKNKEGQYITLLVTEVPLIRGEKIMGVMAFGLDITERKQAEEKLRKTADELAQSNAELKQFAYIASHDLQEPLRMVASFVQLLARKYKGKLDSNADDYIQYTIDGVTRMKALINDLLTFSRIGTRGKSFEPTDCTAVLKTKLQDLKVTIEENNAKVTYDPLPTVPVDEVQLGQLFQNLINNAIKFRSEKIPEIHIGSERQNGQWIFSVKDNGIGIEPEYKERVFVIFQRLHTNDKYSGTGIGLAVCKKIVERHGGKIWLESEIGKGTTFYFTIPGSNGNST